MELEANLGQLQWHAKHRGATYNFGFSYPSHSMLYDHVPHSMAILMGTQHFQPQPLARLDLKWQSLGPFNL